MSTSAITRFNQVHFILYNKSVYLEFQLFWLEIKSIEMTNGKFYRFYISIRLRRLFNIRLVSLVNEYSLDQSLLISELEPVRPDR